MVAPSKSFTVIPDTDIDPDSPVTTGLMTSLRDNDQHLEEWLGDGFVAAVDHDHDGVNSKSVDIGAVVAAETFRLSGGTLTPDFQTGALTFDPIFVHLYFQYVRTVVIGTLRFWSTSWGFANGKIGVGGNRSIVFAGRKSGLKWDHHALEVDAIGGGPGLSSASGFAAFDDTAVDVAIDDELGVDNFQQSSPGIKISGKATWQGALPADWEALLLVFETSS